MTRYVPYRVVKSIGTTPPCFFEKIIEKLHGCVIYFDIKGFTTIVNSYITTGKDIAELETTLSDYYSVIIERIRDYGGSVFQFAGDSILICFEKFEGESDENNFGRALVTMLAAVETSESFNSVVESLAGFSLNPKIGIGRGDFYEMILGDNNENYLTPVLTGDAAIQAVHMEEKCEKPEIVLSATAYECAHSLGLESCFEEKDGVYHLIKIPEDFINKVEPPDYVDLYELFENPRFYNRVNSFISPKLIHQAKNEATGFSGEYRTVTICMVRFDGAYDGLLTDENVDDNYEQLNMVYNSIIKLAEKFDSYCGKPDLSDKGTVFPVFFGTHGSFENRERTAILFANKLVSEVKKQNNHISVCVGVATGAVYAGEFGANMRKDFTIVGNTINYAARLMMKASDAGKFEIRIDARTISKCEGLFELEEITGLMLKGFSEPQTIYKFIAEKTGVEKVSHKTSLVGREKELAELLEIYEKSRNGGECIAPIVGDNGIGKTYLAEQFVESIKEKYDDVSFFQGKAYSHENKTSLFLWRGIIKQITNITDDMEGENLLLHVLKVFSEYVPDDKNWVSYFLSMIGYEFAENPITASLDAAEKNKKIFSIVHKLLLSYAQDKKLVILLSDIHWADNRSLHLLEYIFTHPSNSIFIIPISRKTETIERLFYINNFNVMHLKKLQQDSTSILVEKLLKLEVPNEKFVKKIVSLSDGNPWYAEMIIESLIERGTLLKNDWGNYVLTDENVKIKIPFTIQNLIMSQVGNLSFDSQLVCKNASVIGISFSTSILSLLLPESINEEVLRLSLEELVFNGLIVSTNEKQTTFRFKDSTVRNVIYDSIVESIRKSLCRKLLNYFEEKYKDNLQSVAKFLAYYAQEAIELEALEKYKALLPKA